MGKKRRSGVKYQIRRAIAIALGASSGKLAGNSVGGSVAASVNKIIPNRTVIAETVVRDIFELNSQSEVKERVPIARVLPTFVEKPTVAIDEPEPYIPQPLRRPTVQPREYNPRPINRRDNPDDEDSDASTVEIVTLD